MNLNEFSKQLDRDISETEKELESIRETQYWADYENRLVKRELPENAEDWVELKRILKTYFGVPDQPEFWATIAGHVCSIPSGEMTVSYQFLANTANRLTVNAAAQTVKGAAVRELQERLAKKMAEVAAQMPETVKPEVVSEIASNEQVIEAHVETNSEGFEANSDVQTPGPGSERQTDVG